MPRARGRLASKGRPLTSSRDTRFFLCHRKFFGDQCYNYHLQRRSLNIPSICDTYKKCPDCCHVYEPKHRTGRGGDHRVPDHRCGWSECHICEKKSFCRRTDVTSNASPKTKTSPKRNACRATKSKVDPSKNPNPVIQTHASGWTEIRPFKCTATTKPSPTPKESDTHSTLPRRR